VQVAITKRDDRLEVDFSGTSRQARTCINATALDVKTTVDPKFTRTRLLYQLLGYVLLDYDDAYAIRSVAVYLSRQGLLIRWRLDDLLPTLLDGKQTNLAELRGSFRQAVRAAAVDVPAAVVARAPKE